MNQSVSPTPTKRMPPSPCVGICTMNDEVGLCLGCGRNRHEITGWVSIEDERKIDIWKQLPGRMADLGATSFRLAPEPDQIATFARETLDERAGRWVMGSTGACANFDTKHVIDVTEDADWVTAEASHQQVIRIRKHDRMRVFGLTLGDTEKRMMAVALVIPRGRAKLEPCDAATIVGPDIDAADTDKRSATRLDLAVGRTYSRVLLRSRNAHADQILGQLVGQSFAEVAGQLKAHTDKNDIIVETALGRIESTTLDDLELVTPSAVKDNSTDDSLTKDSLDRFDGIKLSQAFAIGAVFHAYDPAWLIGRLTP